MKQLNSIFLTTLAAIAIVFLFSGGLASAYGSNASLTGIGVVPANNTVNANTVFWVSFVASSSQGDPDGAPAGVAKIRLVFPADYVDFTGIQIGHDGVVNNEIKMNGSTTAPATVSANGNTVDVSLSGMPASLSDTNFTFELHNVRSPKTLNPSGESISIQTFNTTNEVGWGPNATTFSLSAYPAYNVSIVSGDGQSGAVNSTLANGLTVLVTDDFGNTISGYPVAFFALNGSGQGYTNYGAAVGLNSTYIGNNAYSAVTAITDSSGKASVLAFLGNTTLNATPAYVFTASGANLTSAAKAVNFTETPLAGSIAAYNLTPSNSTPPTESQFTLSVAAFDAFSNVNKTSAWTPTFQAEATNKLSLKYNFNGSTSNYAVYDGSAIPASLSSGTTTIYFLHSYAETITFTVRDSNSAIGIRTVILSGTSSTPTPTPTPTPSPSPSPTASPTATPTITPTPTSTSTPTLTPTPTPTLKASATPTPMPTATPTPGQGVGNLIIPGIVLLGLIGGGAYYWLKMRSRPPGL